MRPRLIRNFSNEVFSEHVSEEPFWAYCVSDPNVSSFFLAPRGTAFEKYPLLAGQNQIE
jgi:hypothetical protein